MLRGQIKVRLDLTKVFVCIRREGLRGKVVDM